MITLSAWPGKKGVLLATSLSIYTFVLMFVFRALDFGRFKILTPLEHDGPLDLHSNQFTVPNSSEQSTFPSVTWKTSHISIVRNNSYRYRPQGTLAMKVNIKHIRRIDNLYLKSSKPSHDISNNFRERIQGSFIELFRKTIEVFDLAMTDNGVDYMMYGGTLIGSYRHHGIVPWDDDVDVLLPLSAKRSLYHALKSISPEYTLNHDWVFTWKLFSIKAVPIRGYNWRWPYLDIFFYDENETHIWDAAPQYTKNFVFPKKIIFPLRRRPFMDLFLPAPYNPRAVIDTNYDIDLCKSGTWIHKWERYGIETSVSCSELYFKFPFVRRTFQNGGCNESLIHGGKIIRYFFNNNMHC